MFHYISVSSIYKTKKKIKLMDDYDEKKAQYSITPKAICTLVIGLKLDILPEPIPNTIIKHTENDIHRNIYDTAKIVCTRLKGGDSLIKIVRTNNRTNLFEVLRSINRVVIELPLPMILYVLRYELENIVDDTEKIFNVTCKVISDIEPKLLICGRLCDGLKAKAKIIMWIENMFGRVSFFYEGYVSSEILLKLNVRIFFLSKINNNSVILVESNIIKDVLENMSKTFIDVKIEIDTVKFTYLVFYKRQIIERMLGEHDCYIIESYYKLQMTSQITIRGFKQLNIRRCCLEIQNLLQDVVKIAFVEDEIRVEAHEMFIFEMDKVYNNEMAASRFSETQYNDIYSNNSTFLYSKDIEDKGVSLFKNATSMDDAISNEKLNFNFMNSFESTQSCKNIQDIEKNRKYYTRIEKKIDHPLLMCNRHKSRMLCNCSEEIYKPAQFIKQNFKFIAIGLKKEVKNMLSSSNLLYEVMIDIEPDLEDFLCGKKNGKINKICKDNESDVTITTKIENNERKIHIYIAGTGKNINSAIILLENEYPAELSFYLDEKHHRRIIGYGGRNIQKFMKKHGVYIKFMGNDEWSKQTFPGNVIIKTPRRNIDSLCKMKKDILTLAEEPYENTITHRRFVSIYTYYELFWGNCKLCFDYVILNETDIPRIYLVKPDKISEIVENSTTKLLIINKKGFVFTIKPLDYEIITSNKWVKNKSLNALKFNTVLMYSYEPVFKSRNIINFHGKPTYLGENNGDEYIIGSQKIKAKEKKI